MIVPALRRLCQALRVQRPRILGCHRDHILCQRQQFPEHTVVILVGKYSYYIGNALICKFLLYSPLQLQRRRQIVSAVQIHLRAA